MLPLSNYCFLSAGLTYVVPPCFSHSLLNSFSKISAPLFLVKPVSSNESSHICMSSFPKQTHFKSPQRKFHSILPATNKIGAFSECSSICLATYCPSKCAYHHPLLLGSPPGRTNGMRK